MGSKKIEFGKTENLLYMGIPSGSLHSQVLRLLEKSGRAVEMSRQYELRSPFDPEVVFRVLDRKEMPDKVKKGIVDCGITGKDYIYEAGHEKDLEVVADFIFSKTTNQPSKLVLATRPETGIRKPKDCAGKTVATELPNLTRRRLKELFDVTDARILPSEGKTEAKVFMGESDAFTDITETGKTLLANGNILLAELFQSHPQLIANSKSLKIAHFREKMEDIAIGFHAVLAAEKEPIYLVFMDVPKAVLKDVERMLPAVVAPTVSPVDKEGWVSVSVVITETQLNMLAPKLLRKGVDGIVPIQTPKIFTLDMVKK